VTGTDALIELGAAGKDHRKIVTAVAREPLGVVWAVGTRAETIVSQRVTT
jgi:transposase